MKTNSVFVRIVLLVVLMFSLTGLSLRVRAETGTCGGQMITIPFTDVSGGNIFFCSIAEAYITGLTSGTTPTTYSPTDPVPREQMAAFITRTLDQSLKRGSRRAALGQWWTSRNPAEHPTTGVGVTPQYLVSDGEYVYVSCFQTNDVDKVRASTGETVGTLSFNGMTNLQGAVLDAGRLWLAGVIESTGEYGLIYQSLDQVTTGGPYPLPGTNPVGLAFDGENIWTANFGNGTTGGSITRFNPATLAQTQFTAGFNFTSPLGIVYDGANLWVTVPSANVVRCVNPATGNVVQNVPVGSFPGHPVFDGTNLWVPCADSAEVYVVRAVGAMRGTVLATLSGNGLDGPVQAAFDGERIAVTNIAGSVSMWKATDLTPIGGFPMPVNSEPRGVCSDGTKFWVALRSIDKIVSF